MPINFEGYRVVKLNYEVLDSEDVDDSKSELSARFGLADDNLSGMVELTTTFVNLPKKAEGLLTIQGKYTLDKMLGKEKATQFLAQNGAAMLYPYVRTIISVITSFDDQDVTVLPSLNFIDAFEKSIKKNNEK